MRYMENFFTVWVVRHSIKLPTEVMEPPSLKVFKSCLTLGDGLVV